MIRVTLFGWRNRHLFLLDALILIVTGVLVFAIDAERFDWMALEGRSMVLTYIGLTLPLRLAGFIGIGLYQRIWTAASLAEVERLIAAAVLSCSTGIGVGIVLMPLVSRGLRGTARSAAYRWPSRRGGYFGAASGVTFRPATSGATRGPGPGPSATSRGAHRRCGSNRSAGSAGIECQPPIRYACRCIS